MQVFTFAKYSIIASLAGCPKALAITAIVFCLSVKKSALVAPILFICILQYYDKQFQTKKFIFVYQHCKPAMPDVQSSWPGDKIYREQLH
jgi:hypothetical protein